MTFHRREKCESNEALPMMRARAFGRGGCTRYNIFIITASVMSMLFIVFNLYKLPRYKEAQDNLLGITFDGGNRQQIKENTESTVHFRTYGTKEYARTMDRIVQEALETRWFASVKAMGPDDLTTGFKDKFEEILEQPRGGGYWIWKYDVIEQALQTMDEGEFLVYLDAGSQLNKDGEERFKEYLKILDGSKYDIVCFQMTHAEHKYTTDAIFRTFNVSMEDFIRRSNQFVGGILVMQKGPHLRSWLAMVRDALLHDPWIITDKYNGEAKSFDSSFVDNRHDQSLSSVSMKINGCERLDDESYPFNPAFPFFAARIKNPPMLNAKPRTGTGAKPKKPPILNAEPAVQDYPKPQESNYTTGTNSDPFQDWRASNTLHYPGRFKQAEYHNMAVQVTYNANDNAEPYTRDDCAPGLVCNFSDKSWHETGYHNRFVSFPSSKQGVKNKVQVSMECPVLKRGESSPFDSEDDLAGIATTDLRSDIPTEYMTDFGRISDYYARPKSEGITKWKILYIQSNCNAVASGRGMVIKKLIERGLVDSYGRCDNNAAFPKGLGSRGDQKEKMTKMYAFTAAFENSIYPGYATEKIWQPLWYGSVPIYLGAPDARSFLPGNSTIFVDDFSTVDDLADYIEFLLTHREAYDFYHKWRNGTPPQHLVDLWKFSEQPIDCRLCRWGAENLH